ncbi:MAG: hypothetical protein HOW97_39735 [Catenulispora sp.]|nr:hypothetical protein [Catenulispora sp.]NUS29160.1 hypothetical protein [Streptomyces sp.]
MTSPKCRCDEPDFGGGRPVNEPSAKVSRVCPVCDWTTSVWHVDDGSAEAELHRHVQNAHDGSYEKESV